MSQLVKLVILLDEVPAGQLYLLVSMFGSIIFLRRSRVFFSTQIVGTITRESVGKIGRDTDHITRTKTPTIYVIITRN